VVGLIGLGILAFLGLGAAGSLATLNLPGGICLGSLWLVTAPVWLGLMLARRGETRSQITGARRRLVTVLGQRLFEIAPGPAREQRAQLPKAQIPSLTRPASQLLYLSSSGDRIQQLIQLIQGTLCALVAGNHLELATQTFEVLTASPVKRRVETVKKTAVSRRALYTGAGYLENLILEQLRRSPTSSVRELITEVLRQAGHDLLERVAETAESLPPSTGEAHDLDAQLAALHDFCEQFQALNPELNELLTREVNEAVRDFVRLGRRQAA